MLTILICLKRAYREKNRRKIRYYKRKLYKLLRAEERA
jgi:hypothetical protein